MTETHFKTFKIIFHPDPWINDMIRQTSWLMFFISTVKLQAMNQTLKQFRTPGESMSVKLLLNVCDRLTGKHLICLPKWTNTHTQLSEKMLEFFQNVSFHSFAIWKKKKKLLILLKLCKLLYQSQYWQVNWNYYESRSITHRKKKSQLKSVASVRDRLGEKNNSSNKNEQTSTKAATAAAVAKATTTNIMRNDMRCTEPPLNA